MIFICTEGNGHISENVRTEILFLYSDCPQEMLTNHPKLHLGIGRWCHQAYLYPNEPMSL